MLNRFALRAKWTRKARRQWKAPTEQPKLTPRPDDIPVTLQQYLLAHIHIARCWNKLLVDEYLWFLASIRGELPPTSTGRNFHIHHVFLPMQQYLRALEAITTRLGVKL